MNRSVQSIIKIVIILVMAIFMGEWIITDPEIAGVVVATVGALALFFTLGANVWILIVVCSGLAISFPWIPGSFTPQDLSLLYVIGCTLLLVVARRITFNFKMTSVEWFAVLLALFVLQAFLRNPAGVNLLGSEYVGGRPYFSFVIALVGGGILAATKTNYKTIRMLFHWSLVGMAFSAIINVLAYASSAAAAYTGMLFGRTGQHDASMAMSSTPESGLAGRNAGGRIVATMFSRWLVSCVNPLKAFWHPIWGVLFWGALCGAAMSGYRSVIASTGMSLALGIYYWSRWRGLFVAGVLGLFGYAMLNVVNIVHPLPPSVQRSLSFLPGTWEDMHVEDTLDSTDWRVEMWIEALTSDRYIENKIFGDGYGIRRDNFEYIVAIGEAYILTDEMSRERAMLAGDFHSGPVSAVRVIGYVGLLFLTIAMFLVARRAHRLIIASYGKPYFREVLFFCVPMVWAPIFFLFIYADTKNVMPLLFIQMGLLRIMENNLE